MNLPTQAYRLRTRSNGVSRGGGSNRHLPHCREEQRDVFLLHEEAGLSLDNIARVTGVNRETAKSRLRYAMTKLKASMHDPALSTEDTT